MPGLFSANLAGQVRRNRSMGNAQARNAPLGAAPAYGNTTNPNGAVTASQPSSFFQRLPEVSGGPINSLPGNATPVGLSPSPSPTMPASQPQQAMPAAAPQSPATPQAATYAGGDVAGIASYYRNTAKQMYAPLPVPQFGGFARDAGAMLNAGMVVGNSVDPRFHSPLKVNPNLSQKITVRPLDAPLPVPSHQNLMTRQTPLPGNPIAGPAAEAAANAQFNQQVTGVPESSLAAAQLSGKMTDFNAHQSDTVNGYVGQYQGLTPEQKLQIAQQSAARTMAGGPAADPTNLSGRMAGFNSNTTPWYDRQRNAQREAENTARQQASQKFLAGIPASAATDQSYKGPFGKQTSDGMAYTNRLGALQAMAAANPNDANVASALRAEQSKADTRSEKTAARLKAFKDANGGLSPRQLRRKKETEMAGIPTKAPASDAKVDRTRLPNGQLPAATRERAATTAKNLTDPNYKGPSPEFNQAAEVVRSMGLTADATPFDASRKISSTPIPQDPESRKRYATALRQYWGSMRDSNAAWDGQKNKTGSHMNDPSIDMLNQLAETPENQVDQWLTNWEKFIKSSESEPGWSPF